MISNIQLDFDALTEAAQVTLSWNYPEEEVNDAVKAFALEETRDIVESYFMACKLRVVRS